MGAIEISLAVLVIFVLGMGTGSWVEAEKWARSADGPMRKEYRGRLYQVTHDD